MHSLTFLRSTRYSRQTNRLGHQQLAMSPTWQNLDDRRRLLTQHRLQKNRHQHDLHTSLKFCRLRLLQSIHSQLLRKPLRSSQPDNLLHKSRYNSSKSPSLLLVYQQTKPKQPYSRLKCNSPQKSSQHQQLLSQSSSSSNCHEQSTQISNSPEDLKQRQSHSLQQILL